MKIDNSSYTVTPPDLYMTEHGISIFISSTNNELITPIKELFEKFIATSVVFMVQNKKTNSETLPWMWNVSKTCDFMIIDVDTCAWEDIMAGLLKSNVKSLALTDVAVINTIMLNKNLIKCSFLSDILN